MLEQNASLSEIALLLEAAIQKGDLGEGGYEAWVLLGETRNMDEREEAGMKALMEGVRRAEEAGAADVGKLVRFPPTLTSERRFINGAVSVTSNFIYERIDGSCFSHYVDALVARTLPRCANSPRGRSVPHLIGMAFPQHRHRGVPECRALTARAERDRS